MRSKRILIVCLVVMAFSVNMISAKEVTKNPPEGLTLISDTGNDQLYGVKNEVELSKADNIVIDEYIKNELALKVSDLQLVASEEGASTSSVPYNYYIDGYNSTQDNSISAIMTSQFDSTISVGYWGDFDITGNSKVAFSGIYGYYPDSIALTDTFTLNGLVVSVSASGVGWENGFQSISYTREETGYKELTHSYTGIEGNGLEFTAKQVTSGTFEVGSASYTVKASDISLLL